MQLEHSGHDKDIEHTFKMLKAVAYRTYLRWVKQGHGKFTECPFLQTQHVPSISINFQFHSIDRYQLLN